MKSLYKILSLAILAIFVTTSLTSAASFSSIFSQDFVKVKEKWSYQEDTTGKIRGFNLIHTFFVPREKAVTTYNDRPTTQNTAVQTSTSSGLSVGGGFGSTGGSIGVGSSSFGSGVVGNNFGGGFGSNTISLTNDRAISDAFDTFRTSNKGYSSSNTGFYGGVRW